MSTNTRNIFLGNNSLVNQAESSQNIKSRSIEILKFKNPFHQSYTSSKKKYISVSSAKACIFQLFRLDLHQSLPLLTHDAKIQRLSSTSNLNDSTSNNQSLNDSGFLQEDEPTISAFAKFMMVRNDINQHTPRNNRTGSRGWGFFPNYRNNPLTSRAQTMRTPRFNDDNEQGFICEFMEWIRNYSNLNFRNLINKEALNGELANIPSFIQDCLCFIEVCALKGPKVLREYMMDLILFLAVLLKIESFGCDCELEESENGREVYVFVAAKEEVLLKLAKIVKYRLKLQNENQISQRFQKFSAYGQIPPLINANLSDLQEKFVTYKDESNDAESVSLFTFTDKYKLINRIMNETLDMTLLSKRGLMITRFVLHKPLLLKEIQPTIEDLYTFKSLQSNKIKDYFSESISFYFAFLKFIKRFSILLTLVGLIVFSIRLIHHYDRFDNNYMLAIYIMYSMFLSFWSFWVAKRWERREKYLAWKWGALDSADQQVTRSHFKGKYERDEVTGRYKILKSQWVCYRFTRVFNFFITVSLILLNFLPLLIIDKLKDYLIDDLKFSNFDCEMIIGSVTSIQIYTFDYFFRLIAKKITMWENHETYQQHNDSLIIKLFSFKFVNSYLNLFYIAFFKRTNEKQCENGSCIKELSYRLFVIFATGILLNSVEIFHPLIKNWIALKKKVWFSKSKLNYSSNELICQVEKQSIIEDYDHAVKDYLELIIRMGYLIIFGTTHQLFGALVVFGIYIESRLDIYKLCTIYRRPEPLKTDSIGVWKKIFLFVAICGMFSNIGINIFTTGLVKDFSEMNKLLLFIILEHIIMLIVLVYWKSISNVPKTVMKAKKWGKIFADEKLKFETERKKKNTINENKNKSEKISFTFFNFKKHLKINL